MSTTTRWTPPHAVPSEQAPIAEAASAPVFAARQMPSCPRAGEYLALAERLMALPNANAANNGMAATSTHTAVGVAALKRGDGGSTVALNLASCGATSAPAGVVLVDANAEDAALTKRLGARKQAGWMDVVAGRADLPDCVQQTSVPGLQFLPLGSMEAQQKSNGRGSLSVSAEAACHVLDALRQQFSLVVLDLPPVPTLAQLCNITSRLEGVVVVVQAERATQQQLRDAKQQLALARANPLGIILNRRKDYLPRVFGGTRY